MVATGLLAAVAVVALGQLTSPGSGQGATTTSVPFAIPDTTIGFVEQGEPLDWTQVATPDGTSALTIRELGGDVLLFSVGIQSDNPFQPFQGRGGLFVQRVNPSEPGGQQVIGSEYMISSVMDSSFGLIAAGVEAGSGIPAAWTSDDGYSWQEVELPFDSERHGPMDIGAIHSNDDIVVLVSRSHRSGYTWMRAETEHARQLYGDAVTGVGSADAGEAFTVYGVLGLPIATIRYDESGVISGPEREVEPATIVFASDDGQTWTSTVLDQVDFPLDLYTGPDGKMWMRAYLGSLVGTLVSSDGVDWEETDDGGVFSRAASAPVRWGDEYLAVVGEHIIRSTDGVDLLDRFEIEEIVTGRPHEDCCQWWTFGLSAGDQGIALVARTGIVNQFPPEPEPAVLEPSGSRRVTLSVTRDVVRLTVGGSTLVRVTRNGSPATDEVRFDLEAGTVTFVAHGSEEEYASFTIDELEALGQELPPEIYGPLFGQQVVLFSTDGGDWVVQGVSDLTGGGYVQDVILTGDEMFMITSPTPDTPGGRIWRAPLPES